MLANSVESPVRLGYITSLMIRMGCHPAFAFLGKRIFLQRNCRICHRQPGFHHDRARRFRATGERSPHRGRRP